MAEPPLVDAEELAWRQRRRDADRYQTRCGTALEKMILYRNAGGISQCESDEARIRHNRRSGSRLCNLDDERRCPRCYSTTHAFIQVCELDQGTGSPPFIRTAAATPYRSLTGVVLAPHNTDWCGLCCLWGHPAQRCVLCLLCIRWGRAAAGCASGFLPPGR